MPFWDGRTNTLAPKVRNENARKNRFRLFSSSGEIKGRGPPTRVIMVLLRWRRRYPRRTLEGLRRLWERSRPTPRELMSPLPLQAVTFRELSRIVLYDVYSSCLPGFGDTEPPPLIGEADSDSD